MSSDIDIPIIIDDESLSPSYASAEAAGADVRASLAEEMVLQPGERSLVPTGIKAAIPRGYEIQVRPRSGLAAKNGISLVNSPGTIDSDYRGEIKVIMINHGNEPFTITPGMRIAQLVVAPVLQARFLVAEEALASTDRGEGGFGHTGLQ